MPPMKEFARNFQEGRVQTVKIIFPDKTEVTCKFVVRDHGEKSAVVELSKFAAFYPMVERSPWRPGYEE